MVFTVTSNAERFEDDIWICVHTIVLRIEACLMLKASMRTFKLVMGIA
jgi:hypothetical protein